MTISFDSDRHDDLIAELQNRIVAIQGHLDALEDAVTEGHELWTGDARLAYEVAQEAWTRSMRQLQSVLNQASAAAEASGIALRSAQEIVTGLWA